MGDDPAKSSQELCTGGWNLSRNSDSHENFAHFLRTTGEHKREEKWQKEKLKKREKRRRKNRIEIGYISFWDALWRFRRWANYLEAQTLLEGPVEDEAKEFDSNLNLVLMCTMGVLERYLTALLGKPFMLQAYDDYLSTIGRSVSGEELTKHLTVRRGLVCGLGGV